MSSLVRIEPIGIGPSFGSLIIYSAPRAVTRHIEWTISNLLGLPTSLKWNSQPLEPSRMWCALTWRAAEGTAARMASELAGWHYLKFELQETSSNAAENSLYMFIPELGIFRGAVGPHGDLMINENQINSILRNSRREIDLVTEIEKSLGKPWDEELECYRRAIAEDGEGVRDRLSV